VADSIEKRVGRMWPEKDPQEILDLLNQYTGRGSGLVKLAILKLCEGDEERLPDLLKTAQRDYRDVIAAAENPRVFALTAAERKAMPARKLEALKRKDKREYKRWLRK